MNALKSNTDSLSFSKLIKLMYMYIVGCDSMKVQYDNMGYNVFYVLRSTEISISLLKLNIYTICQSILYTLKTLFNII